MGASMRSVPVVPRTALAAADLAAAVPSAATSFAGHHVLASLFPSRQQSLPPFLDGVVALHLTDARFGISSLSATPEQLTSSQTVGTFVARVLLASKLADGWSLLKTYSFNQTAAATALPPLLQYRPTGIYPQAFNPLPTGLSNSPAAFVYQQLQSVIPLVAAAGKDWVTKRNLKVLGVADPSLVSPFWTQPITGSVYPNTLPASDANAVLGLWFNVSASSNSTAAPNWAGYNFSTAAYLYPDPLYDPVIKAQLQAAIGAVGLAPNPYYGDLNQVRWLGQKNSVYRTKAQTNLAYFWRLGGGTATVPGAFSAIATQLLQANATGSASGVDLYASAALFARLHAAVWDGSVAGWTAKYKFLQWRPETALRYGDNSSLTFNTTSYLSKKPNWPGELTPVFAQPSISTDGTFTPLYNATGVAAGATSGPATDITGAKRQLHSAWSPELTSPGHPEYPSTHSVACKAAVTTLRLFFGTDSVATINNGAVLPLNSEDTYLGNGAGPGDGGRAWMQSATNATNLLTFLNLTGVAGAGNALDTAPFIYSLPLGLSPITYSTLSQMSLSGSFSRSALNDEVGATSPVSVLVVAVLVGVILQLASSVPLLYYLPSNALSAVVIVALTNLLDFEHLLSLVVYDRKDALIWVTSFVAVLFLGVEIGILVAVLVSLALVTIETLVAPTPELGMVAGNAGRRAFRSLRQYPDAAKVPGVVVLHIESPILFASAPRILSRIRSLVLGSDAESAEANAARVGTRAVVLDLSNAGS